MDLSNANPARGHKEVRRSTGHIVVTFRYTSTNRDPNRDKALVRSNPPSTSETYRRQDDVFGYKLQFLLYQVLAVFHNLNCLACCPSTKIIKSDPKSFSSSRRVTRRQVMRSFTSSNGTDQLQNGSSNLLTPYGEQPRLTRTVVTYPRPAFSAAKRKITLQSVLINKPKFPKATGHAELKK